MRKLLNNPLFYFAVSLIHQILVLLPGEFPVIFPDSASYLNWNAQRMPLYPAILQLFGDTKAAAAFQVFVFATAASAFFAIVRMVFAKLPLTKNKPYFIWGAGLYFATNFELLQFSPAILTESLGISIFLFYFLSVLCWLRGTGPSKVYFALSFVIFPYSLFMMRPSFVLVPAAISFFFVLKYFFEKRRDLAVGIAACLVAYFAAVQGYAIWNKPRLGHVGISDIAHHQVFANYMARGIMTEEADKAEASATLKSFAEAYRKMDPKLRDSQYSLFDKWYELNPGKEVYEDLKIVNKELLTKRPLGYLAYSLKNLSVLVDGRASFNYYSIEDRDFLSKVYYGVQFTLDNIFCVFWFIALIYFVWTFRQRALFGVENLVFLTVAVQFLTIAFLGYSELRRQAIGVAAIQMLFVFMTWTYLYQRRLSKKP